MLANATGGSAAPTAIATSSIFGTGAGGQVLAWNSGVPQWVATTTLSNGTGITTTYNAASNQWTITNTVTSVGVPFSHSTNFATTTSATTTSIQTAGVFFASSTAAASQFPFASSTALSAGTLCIAADCRTSWPTGGSASDPFPVHTSYAGLTTSGTSSTLWLTGATVSLAASSSVLTFASSTAFTASGSGYFAADAGASVGVGTTSPWALLSINPNGIAGPAFAIGSSTATNFLVTNAGKVGIGTTSPTYALDVNGDVNVASGKCFRVNGVCIGYTVMLAAIYATSSPGTNVSVIFGNGGPRFSGGTLTLPATTTRFVVEVWGAGGGGGGGGGGGSGGTGGTSSFGTGLATTSATGGGGGVAGGSSAACNGGGGGSGGVGSDGNIINLTGQGGAGGEGVATASYSGKGGSGGSAPRGGGGGQSSFGAGNAGAAFGGGSSGGGGSSNCGGGGGGGGGYASSLYSAPSGTYLYNIGTGGTYGTAGTNTGGNGGVGGIVITVYATSSPNAAGNDYAEMFPVSNPGITAGDIVAVDAGVPVSMKLAAAGEAAPLAGIIATNPGQVLGDINATGERPVALSGRVPAKVNLEAGPISIGDRIAPSSVPGVGKKAGPFDDSVGIALEAFSGDPSTSSGQAASQGSVTVFLDLQRGIDIDQIGMTLLGTNATTTAGTPFDFVGDLLSSIISRITALAASTSDATSTSATSTVATSTAATSTPSIADSFISAIFSRIAQWFADAANGITDFFAKRGHFAEELCVGSTCITEAQLATVLTATNQTPAPPSRTESPPPAQARNPRPPTQRPQPQPPPRRPPLSPARPRSRPRPRPAHPLSSNPLRQHPSKSLRNWSQPPPWPPRPMTPRPNPPRQFSSALAEDEITAATMPHARTCEVVSPVAVLTYPDGSFPHSHSSGELRCRSA